MSLFIKFMSASMIVAVAAPFVLKGPNGQPLQSLTSLNLGIVSDLASQAASKMQSINATSAQITPSTDAQISGAQITNASITQIQQLPSAAGANSFYKWKDQGGTWQFTVTPPPQADIDFSVITTDPNANIIQSLSKNDIATTLGWDLPGSDSDASKEGAIDIPNIPFPSTIPASDIPKLIEQAKAARDMMSDRNKVLDQL